LAGDGRPVSTLHDYLRILRRRKWIVIPAVVLAPLVAVLLSGRDVRLYEASAQVLVNRQNLPANLTGVNDPTQLDSNRLLTTETQFARLPAIARRTLVAAGIRNGSASGLLGASRVTSADQSDFLTFTVSDARPERAMRLATAYAHQFVLYRRAYEHAQLASAKLAVRSRLSELSQAGAINSPLYASLVQTANQLEAMEAVAASKTDLVRPATGAGRAASQVVRNGVFAAILAIMAGVGLAFLRDALDLRARSAEEIGGRLHLRLLGRLPRPPRNLRKANRLAMLAEPEGVYAEPFRMLRSNLEFVIARRPGVARTERRDRSALRPAAARRVMVTSAIEGEGKSTTVANLAIAFARAGRRVILVDLDFRRASLHYFFALPAQPGLTDVVLHSIPLNQAISYIDLNLAEGSEQDPSDRGGASLGIVPLGTLPPHTGDAALTAGLEQALNRLGNDADLILIDAPPLLRVGDALALTSYVDSILVVTNLRAVSPAMLDELRRVLEDCPTAKLGFVLTGADLEGGYEYITSPYARQRAS
jgi:succinoglycan biosynthesis transport protein ExoP